MAVYFVGAYPELYENLKSKPLLEENKNSLMTSMSEVDSEMNGITGILTELEGKYTGELSSTFEALVQEVMVTYTMISDGLTEALVTMDDLSGNLDGFKTNDESYEENSNELTAEQSRKVEQYTTNSDNEKVVRSEYTTWQNTIADLKATLEELKRIIDDFKEKCDNNILSIDEFNDSVVNIRLKMATIAFAQDGMTLEQIQNLTPEEREKLIEKMIDAMTVKYNEYKAKYEEAMNRLRDDYDFQQKLNALIGIYNGTMGGNFDFTSYDLVRQGFELCDFLVQVESIKDSKGRTFLECLEEYYRTGDFVGSGMEELYRSHNGSFGFSSGDYELYATPENLEKWFNRDMEEMSNLHDYDDVQSMVTDVIAHFDDFKDIANTFKENYNKACEVGAAIQGLKELKAHSKYDAMTLTSEFQDMELGTQANKEFLKKLVDERYPGVDKIKYMSSSELKMFRYLYETQGKDAASTYAKTIDQTLTRREGYVNATKYYYYLKDGSNSGLDAVWDHLSAGGTGFGDGIVDFCDGLVDLVAPSKTMSANEYSKLALIGMLSDGDDYDKGLLAAYNIGSTIGEEAIPAVVSIINPAVGKGLKIASATGNAIEEYYRADDSTTYFEAALHAGVDLFSTEGIDMLATATGLDKTPVGKLGVAAFKNLAKTTTDFMYDPENTDLTGEGIVTALMGSMKGQVSGELADRGEDMFADWLQGMGWPKDWAKTTAKLFKPVIEDGAGAAVDGGLAMAEAGTRNAVTGSNEDILRAGVDTAYDSFTGDLGGSLGKTAKATGKEVWRQRTEAKERAALGGLFD